MTDQQIATRLTARLEQQLEEATAAVGSDAQASPVLAAVLGEFARKFAKTRTAIEGSGAAAREAVVELEQAADSAKWAATADPGLGAAARAAVIGAHDTICTYKSTGQLLGD